LIKKDLSKQDKEDWQDFIDNHSPIPNKDGLRDQKNNAVRKFKFDFHGYTIAGANKKINEIINSCYEKGVSEILIITGKGIHSKSKMNVYASKELSTLKNTIPDFLKTNPDLNSKIDKIKQADKDLGGSGAILIKLKKSIK
tara:strand:- start:1001 stop:1423 length:423 start_codon:yes stop_codon:yes gene_type:complete